MNVKCLNVQSDIIIEQLLLYFNSNNNNITKRRKREIINNLVCPPTQYDSKPWNSGTFIRHD